MYSEIKGAFGIISGYRFPWQRSSSIDMGGGCKIAPFLLAKLVWRSAFEVSCHSNHLHLPFLKVIPYDSLLLRSLF